MILAAAASDAGAYYVQAVNERNGENKTSPPVHLSVASECRSPGATGGGGGERWVQLTAADSRGVLQQGSPLWLEVMAQG